MYVFVSSHALGRVRDADTRHRGATRLHPFPRPPLLSLTITLILHAASAVALGGGGAEEFSPLALVSAAVPSSNFFLSPWLSVSLSPSPSCGWARPQTQEQMESYIYKMLGAILVTLGEGISDAVL